MDTDGDVLAMFPLASVLVPGMVLPLHVFEERYLCLMDDVLSNDQSFGVVLIERGSEVGGGDVRCDVGTRAKILGAERAPDGRWGVVAFGTERIRVIRWLPDAPYPRAEVTRFPDAVDGSPQVIADLAEHATALVRTALARRVELGDLDGPIDLDLLADFGQRSFQLTALGPFGAADRQRLLEAQSTKARFELLAELAAEDLELSELRLRQG